MDPVSLFALIGAVVAFVLSGAITAVLYVVAGALCGAAIGMFVKRFARKAQVFEEAIDLREHATRTELYERAKELDIEGRSTMSKDELIGAITDAES